MTVPIKAPATPCRVPYNSGQNPELGLTAPGVGGLIDQRQILAENIKTCKAQSSELPPLPRTYMNEFGITTTSTGQQVDTHVLFNALVMPQLRQVGKNALSNLGIDPKKIVKQIIPFSKSSPEREVEKTFRAEMGLPAREKAKISFGGDEVLYGTGERKVGFNGKEVSFSGGTTTPTSATNWSLRLKPFNNPEILANFNLHF